jgi:hypothetical protein
MVGAAHLFLFLDLARMPEHSPMLLIGLAVKIQGHTPAAINVRAWIVEFV